MSCFGPPPCLPQINHGATALMPSSTCWMLSNFALIEGKLWLVDDSNAASIFPSALTCCIWTAGLVGSSLSHKLSSSSSSLLISSFDSVSQPMRRTGSCSFRGAFSWGCEGSPLRSGMPTREGIPQSFPRRLNGWIYSSFSSPDLLFGSNSTDVLGWDSVSIWIWTTDCTESGILGT